MEIHVNLEGWYIMNVLLRTDKGIQCVLRCICILFLKPVGICYVIHVISMSMKF